jgi:serine protease Do
MRGGIRSTLPIGLAFLALGAAVRGQSGIDESRRTAVVRAAEIAGPGVVSISVISTRMVRSSPFLGSFWDYFFPPRYFEEQIQSLGSGFIVDEEGYTVTNHHVVENADLVKVTLPDGRVFDAELVGSEERLDLALLRIDGDDLPMVPLGDSDSLFIGEWCIAVGNPFGFLLEDLEPTVTVGVVSATHRTIKGRGDHAYRDMIQSDAAINPGNSGGPLVNSLGEAIGVNTFIFSSGGGSEGVGFAIPINIVKKAIREFTEHGRMRRGYIGLSVQGLTEDLRDAMEYRELYGVMVVSVDPEMPVSSYLTEGVIIQEIQGRKLFNTGDFEDVTNALTPGEAIRVSAFEDGSVREFTLTAEAFAEGGETFPFGIVATSVTPSYVHRFQLMRSDGALVIEVEERSSAERLGFRRGDVIVELNGVLIHDLEDLELVFGSLRTGRVTFMIDRYGSRFLLTTLMKF